MTSTTRETILVIDDSETILEKVRIALTAAGYEVITSTQPLGNARHLTRTDLVIIDFHMPGIDGGSVLSSLRDAVGNKHTCLFYLYSSDREIADEYARYGFDGSITSKGDMASLVSQVNSVFRLIRIRRLTRK